MTQKFQIRLTRLFCLRVFACITILFAIMLPKFAVGDESPPNIVLILADDMGIDSVSAFNDQMGMKTASLDQLAKEGMSFTDAHSPSSVCTPTRYSILTGRYSWRSRLKRGIVKMWERPLLEPDRMTLPKVLKANGYHTACIGKWHLGLNWPRQGGGFTNEPDEVDFTAEIRGGAVDQGFDYYFGDDVPNWPPYSWIENRSLLAQPTTLVKRGAMVGVRGGPAVENWDFHAVLKRLSEKAVAYVHERASRKQPFFLFLPLTSPHTPIAPSGEFQGKTGVSPYADYLLQTDQVVGDVLKALRGTGMEDDTLVIFTADNGTSPQAKFNQLRKQGIHLNVNWRGWKADIFEGGHRVPFIVRWPGKVKPNSASNETITLADILATVCEIVDFQVSPAMAEDSVSLTPVLLGAEAKQLHPQGVVHHSINGNFAIRNGDWKLIFAHGSGGWSSPREQAAMKQGLPAIQLYNLANDPKEQSNLASSNVEKVSELTTQLKKFVANGRSTPGPVQPYDQGKIWWQGLPWPEEASR